MQTEIIHTEPRTDYWERHLTIFSSQYCTKLWQENVTRIRKLQTRNENRIRIESKVDAGNFKNMLRFGPNWQINWGQLENYPKSSSSGLNIFIHSGERSIPKIWENIFISARFYWVVYRRISTTIHLANLAKDICKVFFSQKTDYMVMVCGKEWNIFLWYLISCQISLL